MAVTRTYEPSADSEFQNDSPNFNNGTVTNFNVGEEDFTSTTYRAVLSFDLSGLSKTVNISSAVLKLTVYADSSNGTGRLKVYVTTSSWTETGVTWNTQPSKDATVQSTYDIGNGFTGQISVTIPASVVQAWINSPSTNYGLFLRITETTSDNENDKHFKFRSREYATSSDRPQLDITYTQAPPPQMM